MDQVLSLEQVCPPSASLVPSGGNGTTGQRELSGRFQAFQEVVSRVQQQINDPVALGKLYNAFLHHTFAEGFNAKSLNTKSHSTPVMRLIQEANRQISTEQLEEFLNFRGEPYITQTDLVHYFQQSMRTNVETIRHKMLELGWNKVSVKWGSVDYNRVLWVGPGHSVQRGKVFAPDGTQTPIKEELEFDL
ncbi:hypothetical protein [Lacimonas salitolerans]|uniref:Uncharacterized protein n=1 Tax=Lacimonas salitolerans TaxID=1323750 RepID=A0ABW4ELX3_9RHOB